MRVAPRSPLLPSGRSVLSSIVRTSLFTLVSVVLGAAIGALLATIANLISSQ